MWDPKLNSVQKKNMNGTGKCEKGLYVVNSIASILIS